MSKPSTLFDSVEKYENADTRFKQVMSNLIESVFARPKIYTLTGSYGEVVAFLSGYYSGVAKEQQGVRETVWISFCIWLSKRLNVSTADEFSVLYEQYQDESLDVLARLYDEFKLLDFPTVHGS